MHTHELLTICTSQCGEISSIWLSGNVSVAYNRGSKTGIGDCKIMSEVESV